MAKKRTNVIPVIEDARHPHKYRMLIGEPERGDLGGPRGGLWVLEKKLGGLGKV